MGDIKCLSCGKECEDYQELALHISSSKTGHKKGKRWAARYLSRHVVNKVTREFYGGTPLTAEDKQSKEDTKRVLSGQQRVADTVCPKCRHPSREVLEAEYVSSSQAWRIQGKLAKMCTGCEG
jgi:hypothetical protein